MGRGTTLFSLKPENSFKYEKASTHARGERVVKSFKWGAPAMANGRTRGQLSHLRDQEV